MTTNKKLKILIIEDDKMLLTALDEGFRKKGCDVVDAVDGEEGIKQVKESPDFDIIVLDIILPKVDGFDVLRELKKDKKLNKIPVVVLTNLSDDATIAAIVAVGGTDYLVKADYTLVEIVEKVLEIAKRPN